MRRAGRAHRGLAGRLLNSAMATSAIASIDIHAVRVESSAAMLPHPAKAHTGGEDAFFIQERGCVFGVFDGVGGWATQGVDAGAFSRALATKSSRWFAKPSSTSPSPSVLELEKALDDSLAQISTLGSCTACLLSIDRCTASLRALNVGDSGFRIFRRDGGSPARLRLELASRSQQHYFNCPLQLGGGSADRPRDGDSYTHTVRPGDIVVMATDGVFDNLFEKEMMTLLEAGGTVAELSERVAASARKLSLDERRRSPFAVEAAKAGQALLGGKLDDTTVILIEILEPERVDQPKDTIDAADAQAEGASATAGPGEWLRSKL